MHIEQFIVYNVPQTVHGVKYTVQSLTPFNECVRIFVRCTAQHCITLCSTALYSTALMRDTVVHCTEMRDTVVHCTVMYITELYSLELHCTV